MICSGHLHRNTRYAHNIGHAVIVNSHHDAIDCSLRGLLRNSHHHG
jgi:hypothetical protein